MLVSVGDTRLFVDERGRRDGLPLLILHGGPGLDHREFGEHLDPLGDEFRLLFVDQRAQGRSERNTGPETWTLQKMSDDVAALARSLELGRYAVLGHSYGAFVALEHAVDVPAGPAATIVSSGLPSSRWLEELGATLDAFEPVELREQVKASWEREASVQSEEEFAQLLADQLPWHFAAPRDPRIAAYLAQTEHMRYAPAILRATSLEGGGLTIEVEAELPHVTQPLLACTGRHDRTCGPEAAARIAELVPRGELYVFEAAGHMAFVESTEEYLQVVTDFLDRATS